MSKNTARNEARREAKEAKKILAALLIAPDTENYQTLPNLNPDNICPIGPTCCCLDNDCLDRSLQETDFFEKQKETLQEEAIVLGINPYETMN
jgi:hypothetical protein